MSKTTSSSSSGGIGFAGLLTVLFIGLKLTNYIQWSWIWVVSPLWIWLAILIFVLLMVGFVALCFLLFDVWKFRKHWPRQASKSQEGNDE